MKEKAEMRLYQQERWCFPWWMENDGSLKFEILVILVRDVTGSKSFFFKMTMDSPCCSAAAALAKDVVRSTFQLQRYL
jgi:hypothetical protein